MSEKTCSFCGAARTAVRYLVECPRARICESCVARGAHATDTDEGITCLFCQKARASLIDADGAICPECIELARQIIVEASPGLPPARVVKR